MPTWRAKYQRWSGTIALLAVAVTSAVGLRIVDNEARARSAGVRQEGRARSTVDAARTAQLAWDKADGDHATCLRSAEGRLEVRRTFDEVFDSIARFATPERKAEVQRFVTAEHLLVAAALPSLDCDKLAPRPKGLRPAIPSDGPFKSCRQARASGPTPIHRGEPGWNARLDGDGDGMACE